MFPNIALRRNRRVALAQLVLRIFQQPKNGLCGLGRQITAAKRDKATIHVLIHQIVGFNLNHLGLFITHGH